MVMNYWLINSLSLSTLVVVEGGSPAFVTGARRSFRTRTAFPYQRGNEVELTNTLWVDKLSSLIDSSRQTESLSLPTFPDNDPSTHQVLPSATAAELTDVEISFDLPRRTTKGRLSFFQDFSKKTKNGLTGRCYNMAP
jgi:hypothetical protein